MTVKVQNTEVKVGPIIYKILWVEELRSADGDLVFGKVLYDMCEIHLEAGNSPQADRQTLWHEIVHIILTHLGRDEDREGFVDSLAYGLMQVVQDNAWLAEKTE